MECESKLSADLFDIFQLYKRASEKVISWLALTSETNGQRAQSWSLDRLKQVAKVVKRKAIKVPDGIYFAFQDAIKFHSALSLQFKQNGTVDDFQNFRFMRRRLDHTSSSQRRAIRFVVLLGGRLEFDRKNLHRKKGIHPYDRLDSSRWYRRATSTLSTL